MNSVLLSLLMLLVGLVVLIKIFPLLFTLALRLVFLVRLELKVLKSSMIISFLIVQFVSSSESLLLEHGATKQIYKSMLMKSLPQQRLPLNLLKTKFVMMIMNKLETFMLIFLTLVHS